MRSMVSRLEIAREKTRVGVAAIAEDGVDEIFLSSHSDRGILLNAIDNIPFRNSPANMAEALRFVGQTMFDPVGGERPLTPDILVIIHSATLPISDDAVIDVARELQFNGMKIMTITYGTAPDMNRLLGDLREIASEPFEDFHYMVDRINDLESLYDVVLPSLCREIPGKDNKQNTMKTKQNKLVD